MYSCVKLSEENIENLSGFGLDSDILQINTKTQSRKDKFDKLDFIKMKSFCSVKDTLQRMKKEAVCG